MRLSALNEISMTVSTSLNLNEILNRTLEKITEILESSSVRIYLLDERKEALKLVAHKGFSSRLIGKSFFKTRKVGDGLLGKTVQECKTIVVENQDRTEDLRAMALLEVGLQSTVYIPLICKGKAVGVMPVSKIIPWKFSEEDVQLVTAIGNQIGVAVDNANLYENLKNAYQDLKMTQEQLIRSEKLASLGKLAATIAHEINNPLAAVLTYSRLMMKLARKNRIGPDRSEEISRYLQTMESETARCGEIVKNLLAFSRHSKITIEEHRIESILDKTIVLITHELEMKEIKLIKRYEKNLPKIQCDAKQMQQALLNLVVNASEAMAEGGTLTVESRRSQEAGYLEVNISDTGYGIPNEDLKNIFEPFFTTKEEGKGVGLGLSVVYGIITRHNGFIDVTSELGKGSTFKIRLPYGV
jgi:two-component system NtrC family sensor kinase